MLFPLILNLYLRMKYNWDIYKFKDVVNFQPSIKLFKGEEYFFVPMEDVESYQGFLEVKNKKKFDGSSCTKFEDRDIIFARITPCLQNRKITQIRLAKDLKGFGSTEFFVFRARKNKMNQLYLSYFVKTNSFVESAINSMVGASGRQRADKDYINNLEIVVPPLQTQTKIANILSAYDELIENNNKRIAILEQMAEQLYKEWFVRMRFPNYENTQFIKGIPEKWEIKKIKDFGKVVTGKTPSTIKEEYFNGGIPFIKTPDMHNNMFVVLTSETLSQKGFESQPSQKLPANSISVSCIGTGGVVTITNEISMTNQQINTLIPKNIKNREFLYFTLLKLKPVIEMFGATGATMTNLSKGKFEKLLILKPDEKLIEAFHLKTESIFEEIKNLSHQNINLRKTRDLLLPRLISGKLSVDEITIVN